MNLAQMIKPELIRLDLETTMPPEPEEPYNRQRFVWSIKEAVLSEMVGLIAECSRIGSAKRLLGDISNREKKASTGLSDGIAIPHVRTKEAREFTMAFGRSTEGLEFDSIDGKPAHLFFFFVAPPYDDTVYLKIYKQLAEAFTFTNAAEVFMNASEPGEVIRELKRMS
jgi:mannitol/fructose-specific phosphotransferase system IIA component (Ntr-type)